MIKKRFRSIIILMSLSIFSLIGIQYLWFEHYSEKLIELRRVSVNNSLDGIVKLIIKNKKNDFNFYLTNNTFNINEKLKDNYQINKPAENKTYTNGYNNNIKVPLENENNDILFTTYFNDKPEFFFKQEQLTEIKILIQEYFLDNGIEIPFEFGIIDFKTNNVLMKTKNFNYFLDNRLVFDKKISQSNISKISPILRLHLNEKNIDVMSRKTLLISIASFSLILVIIICFITTIYIVFSQKKIALMKSDFINNMTHEFKTPITTISLATQILESISENIKKEKIIQFTKIIKDESERLASFVDRILQMSVYEKGNIKLKFVDVSVNSLINLEYDKLKKVYNEKNLKIEYNLNAKEDVIKGDEVHISNVINNLVENAIKYTKEIPRIIISTSNNGGKIRVSVRDFGIGISKKYHGKVFDELFRVPQGNLHDFKGFGLGLAYVKKIIEKHNGTIELESEHGKGSNFIIEIPLKNYKNYIS